MKKTLIGLIFALLATPALASYPVVETDDVPYGPSGAEETLDLFLPVGAPGPLKFIIAMHGGAWVEYDKGLTDGLCLAEVARGYGCASINYPLVTGELRNGQINPAETNYWPRQINAAQLSIRWARANYLTLGIARNMILAYGESAGGTLALDTGSMAGIVPGGAEAGLYTNYSPKANVVVAVSAPTDLVTLGLLNGYDRAGGLMFSDDPAVLEKGSPVDYVRLPATVPTVIVQGASDTLLPAGQPQEELDALAAAGVVHDEIICAGAHICKGMTAAAWQQVRDTAIDLAFSHL